MMPSMSQFDQFVTNACGSYCLTNCEYGFPSLVLTEIKKCLSKEDRRDVTNTTSNTLVQVCYQKYKVTECQIQNNRYSTGKHWQRQCKSF